MPKWDAVDIFAPRSWPVVCAVHIRQRRPHGADLGPGHWPSHLLHVIPVHYEALAFASSNDCCLVVGNPVGLPALSVTWGAQR